MLYGAHYLVLKFEKVTNFTNPEALLMERLELVAIDAEISQDVTVCQHRLKILTLFLFVLIYCLLLRHERAVLRTPFLKFEKLIYEELVEET